MQAITNFAVIKEAKSALTEIIRNIQLTDRPFMESTIGWDSAFQRSEWYNHNCSRFGTSRDFFPRNAAINIQNELVTILFTTTLTPPIDFCQEFCRMYGVNLSLYFAEITGRDLCQYLFDGSGMISSRAIPLKRLPDYANRTAEDLEVMFEKLFFNI